MNVNGIEITQAQIDGAIAFMRKGPFKAADLVKEMERLGVPAEKDAAYRGADRLIQQQRKRGNITVDRYTRSWTWCGAAG